MKVAIVAELVAVALSGALLFATSVKAEPTARECWAMANTVKSALASHANDQAQREYQAGTEACSRGYTAVGVAHFQAAMKALGG